LRDDLLQSNDESFWRLIFGEISRRERQKVATFFLTVSSEFSQNTELSIVPDFEIF
jgi:hypothetical protein